MVDNKTVISVDKMAQAARDFAAAAAVFDAARTRFNDRLAQHAYPRPWDDDAIGSQFDGFYNDAESGTRKALDDVVTGLSSLSERFHQMSASYQSVEDGNAH